MIQYTIVLAIIAAASGGILFFVNSKTRDRIAENQQLKMEKSLKKVLPDAEKIEPVKDTDGNAIYYIGKDKDGKITGYASPGKANGYSSTIKLFVGVSPDFLIKGVSIEDSKETPGLGERIKEIKRNVAITDMILTDKEKEKEPEPWFLKQFTGKKHAEVQLNTENGIDAITGATISSRAVVKAVIHALENLKTHLNKNDSQRKTAPPVLTTVRKTKTEKPSATETE